MATPLCPSEGTAREMKSNRLLMGNSRAPDAACQAGQRSDALLCSRWLRKGDSTNKVIQLARSAAASLAVSVSVDITVGRGGSTELYLHAGSNACIGAGLITAGVSAEPWEDKRDRCAQHW